MKIQFLAVLLGLLVMTSPVYGQRFHHRVNIEELQNRQTRFLNQLNTLQQREQSAVSRQRNLFRNYTDRQTQTLQDVYTVHSELYQVKQQQEKVYQEYIASLEKMFNEKIDAQFKPLEFQNIVIPGGNE